MNTQNNKRIAEFMDNYKLDHKGQKWYNNTLDADYYEFDTSWDWLMPVCIKLKIDYICTDIKIAYKKVIDKIENGNVEKN